MHLTIATPSSVIQIEVSPDMTVETVKAVVEAESGIPAKEINLIYNMRPLEDPLKTMDSLGVKDNDMMQLMQKPAAAAAAAAAAPQPAASAGGMKLPDFGAIRIPGQGAGTSAPGRAGPSTSRGPDSPEAIRQLLASSPEDLAMLRQNNPALAEAFDSGDMEKFKAVLLKQKKDREERERKRLRMLTADPFDLEAQRLIQQEIESKNIDQNMELAMEYNPESFGTVVMLYIDCKVNGHPIKAFVDSGAQATLMSQVRTIEHRLPILILR